MIDTNVIHDPEKLLADLRQHLAGHDKPIGFLFGAGTSCAVRVVRPGETSASPLIPDVKGLTSQCKDAATRADSTFRLAWEELEERCEARKESTNIENILSRLAVMRDAIGPRDRLVGLDRSDLERLEGHSLLEGRYRRRDGLHGAGPFQVEVDVLDAVGTADRRAATARPEEPVDVPCGLKVGSFNDERSVLYGGHWSVRLSCFRGLRRVGSRCAPPHCR